MATFKTRARALDLLGRQQIAGIPTAINELLKNSHDAYADKVDIDYFRSKDLFILRDDGIGMTKEDFEERWLTLGTESKVNHKKSLEPRIDPNKSYRIPMGEKGIGRLAIASIGRLVLIITKAKGQDRITAALIHWQLFEIPGLNLEDIPIPIQTFEALPNLKNINSMKSEVSASIDSLKDRGDLSENEYKSLQETLANFNLSPEDLNKKLVGKYDVTDIDNSGTFFYVSSIDPIINNDIDGSNKGKEATKIEKMLMGFHNTMTPEHPKPTLNIIFRDYRYDEEKYIDIIDRDHFFLVEDFEKADHHFEGKFDEFGQFKGMVKIYHEKTFDHIVNWPENNFKPTKCGPFTINFAYIQGRKVESILDPENHAIIKAKADKFGGLYIYKDNIRILPYGDSDYDYLEIEKRRNFRFSAFFSYRRMFGVINISHSDNGDLKEKAGREGFIENKAYRQMQNILKNFFIQIAADFFSSNEDSPKSELWNSKKTEITQSYKALEKREKQAKERKARFESNLNSFFKLHKENAFTEQLDILIKEISFDFKSISSEKDEIIAGQKVLDVESKSREKINEYRKSIIIPSPRGFYIKGELKKDYETYLEIYDDINTNIFEKSLCEIDNLVEGTISKLHIEINKRRRLEQAVEAISEQARKINSEKRKLANNSAIDISNRVKSLANELMIDLDDQIRDVKNKFKSVSIDDEPDINLVALRNALSDEITLISERNTNILDTIIRQLEGIYWEKDEENNYITNDQITGALSEELDSLREKINVDVELSQLGLAVGVIHHEFNSTVRSIRHSLKDLKAWSDVNEDLDGVYKNIKVNFEHLDGYLNLFTPLNRRLSRRSEDIKLLEVKNFLIDLFKSRFKRHDIVFKHTNGFAKASITGYRSTFYPVFVNVIDNAIHWLNESGISNKTIRLHADPDGSVYISNNGLDIKIQDKSKIFNLGFSRKDNGRGMGLHISNEVLESAGYRLLLDEPRDNSTVTFKISKVNDND
ncbi:histidine kinase [Vibrio sp. N418]|uniref:ATP-binding protein n=1 Tax=Vibrio sp. (strain N418) TaxID=701176 RepID=UPI00021BDF48|nr:ATP-binding protein [Vibrio sp. N418]EGU33477.1 histidine kinase [Vibrio sp. N418]